MTKLEFLTELQRTLNGRLGSKEAAPHVAYYQEYIEIQVRDGREEADVINELGSPRLLGKNIGDFADRNSQKSSPNGKALAYGTGILEYGVKVGKRCASLGAEAINKAKKWLK